MPEFFRQSALRQPIIMTMMGILLAVIGIAWLVWDADRKAATVAAQTAQIRQQDAIDKRAYLQAHQVTHQKLEEVKRTQEHLIRQQDMNMRELAALNKRVK